MSLSWLLVVHVKQVALLVILAGLLDQLVDALCLECALWYVSIRQRRIKEIENMCDLPSSTSDSP